MIAVRSDSALRHGGCNACTVYSTEDGLQDGPVIIVRVGYDNNGWTESRLCPSCAQQASDAINAALEALR